MNGEFDSAWEIIQLLIGLVLLISMYFFFFNVIFKRRKLAKLKGDDLKYFEVQKIRKQLLQGKIPNSKDLKKFSKNIKHRYLLFELLSDLNQVELFPKEDLSREQLSESYLANWLDMHDEFDQFPNEVRVSNEIKLKNNILVLILEFKVHHPYEWAKKEWMLAYVFYRSTDLKPLLICSDLSNEPLFDLELTKKLESLVSNHIDPN